MSYRTSGNSLEILRAKCVPRQRRPSASLIASPHRKVAKQKFKRRSARLVHESDYQSLSHPRRHGFISRLRQFPIEQLQFHNQPLYRKRGVSRCQSKPLLLLLLVDPSMEDSAGKAVDGPTLETVQRTLQYPRTPATGSQIAEATP